MSATTAILIMSEDLFRSLPPLYQGAARVLEREGKVQIGKQKPAPEPAISVDETGISDGQFFSHKPKSDVKPKVTGVPSLRDKVKIERDPKPLEK